MFRLVLACLLLYFALPACAAEPELPYKVGVAAADITPDHPIRLNGFGFRRTESEGVYQKIHARALAIQHKDEPPVVLMTVDVLGIPADIFDELAKRLEKKAGLKKERLAITATHTHTGPMLKGANVTIFGTPIPKEHFANIDKYTPVFLDRLESAALAALKEMKPARLEWGVGKATFAMNRRKRPIAPIDHDLPVLFVKDTKGVVRAVYLNYACHCVTLSHNKIGGDWAGYAALSLEEMFPGATALIGIGCGADQNPNSGVTGDKVDIAAAQGREIAAEVKRLSRNALAPVTGPIVAKVTTLELPLAELPTRKEWAEKAKLMNAIGHHARETLKKLDRGEKLPTKIDYPVATWAFGDSLAMAFLPGEVVVDYSLRLKKELDARRLWVTAYANNAPCYIPSERVLKEGGYEGGGAMIYYDLPAAFKPGLEDRIIAAVKEQIGKEFQAKFDPARTGGSMPLSPHQSLALIQTKPDLTIDLVAAEPLVSDPVALAFGPDGKLWVAEMSDYPNGATNRFDPGGRVVFLEDRDGDGLLDASTLFLDGLPFPTGVLPWRKGVLVCAAPDILYAEDTDADGKADKVEKLYSGFGTENYQARVNGLQYGLDGWVYGSCGLFGGNIVCHHAKKTVALGNRDFRIKPDTGEMEPASGRTQQGRVRDDRGNWFGCDNSNLIWHYPLADHYLRRNPHVAYPGAAVLVPAGPNPKQLFSLRTDAQRFKLSGPPNTVTAACGLGIYRDDLLGKDYRGDAFVCEPVNLLVTRRKLVPKGATFTGPRAKDETDREFLASTDPWFRPVQAITGPDGGLWIADMYRFLIEHPRWVPPEDLAKIDIRAGAGLGRIYRVRPKDQPLRAWPRLDNLDTAGLVAALDSPNGWQRDMAMMMITWKGDGKAKDELEKLVTKADRAVPRMQALCTLGVLSATRKQMLVAALRDTDPAVRSHAVRLSESLLATNRDLAEVVIKLAEDDPDSLVRLQTAYSLGAWPHVGAGACLGGVALEAKKDPYLAAAALSSLNSKDLVLGFSDVIVPVGARVPPELIRNFFSSAIGVNGVAELQWILMPVTRAKAGRFEPWQLMGAAGVLDALERKGIRRDKLSRELHEQFDPLIGYARGICEKDEAPEVDLLAAIPLLGRDAASRGDDIKRLAGLTPASRPAEVQTAAVAALARIADAKVPPALIAAWGGASPVLRTRILDALLARAAWHGELLAAVEKGKVPAGQIDAARRRRLTNAANEETRTRAEKLFAGSTNPDRQKVVDEYKSALDLKGNAEVGKIVFAKSCAPCHAFDGTGHAVGPDLAALPNKSPLYLLTEILDPSRNLDSRYAEYQATTQDGRLVSGLLAAETATSITLRGQMAKDETILRSDIDNLRGTAKSLMPEGLEKEIPKQDFADLIAYLTSAEPLEKKSDPATMAKQLLDDSMPREKREALAKEAAAHAAEVIRAMTADLPDDPKEEYRRIPWIWRVAIAAGRANDAKVLTGLIDLSLPKPGSKLRDWQAVVLGGGVINGLSLEGHWPGRRVAELIRDNPELERAWREGLKQSHAMADDEKVRPGTRYDALRIVALDDWMAARPRLAKYLAKDANRELQMGTVSGLVDVENLEATALLIQFLPDLAERNRTLALAGLVRGRDRITALLDAIEAGKVKPDWLAKEHREVLLKHRDDAVRTRAAKLLKP